MEVGRPKMERKWILRPWPE
uniref:Uncharacterized protein n=1 Tax=Anguilla anguilla TaxID=7936 RepID=A0A0E9TXT7_ANGAN